MLGIITSLCTTFFEALCVVVFFDTFYTRKMNKHRYLDFFLMVTLITISMVGMSAIFRGEMSIRLGIIKALSFVILYTLFCLLFYKDCFPSTIFVSLLAFFITYITDYVGLSITDWLSGRENAMYTIENPVIRTALAITYKIGLFFILMLIRVVCKKFKIGKYKVVPSNTSPRWVLFLLMPALSIASIISLVSVAEPQYYHNAGVVLVSIGWLIMTVVIFFLLQIFDEKEMARHEAQIINEHTVTELESVRTVSQVQEDYHDYQHHLMWIEQLLEKGQNKQAYDYIRSSPYACIVTQPRIHTENEIIDAIVNQKCWKAKNKSTYIVPIMNNIPKLSIDDHDLVAILANLLDNAIEACEHVSGERVIQLKLVLNEDNLVISVRNPVEKELQIVDGTIISSKDDNQHHGYGMRSVQRALEKYNAAYGYECKDKFFQYSAVIPLDCSA